MIGSTLSHFKITALLGQGGMGEVYRAEDTVLEREVAIKVLPEAVASDPDRLARFEREARVLASLNHPNIATIYSIEAAAQNGFSQSDPESGRNLVRFLVMELVEGEVLSASIGRGPLSVEETLAIALQIADALEAAHEKSIVHRDLKPGNVMITSKRRVKVLDFGLARRHIAEAQLGEEVPTATMTELTRENQIVGTIPYMSPEQLRSGPVDPRSDLFSLGVMSFEMLSRQRPFQGDTSVDLISSILREPAPDLTALRPEIPTAVQDLIANCLAKEPGHRPPSAAALRERLVVCQQALAKSEDPSENSAGQPDGGSGDVLDPRVIAVLPFVNLSRDEEAEFLATGLHNDLITDLSKIEGLTIISRSSVVRYRQSDKSLRHIGQELGAGTLIEGTVQRIGNRVRLTAQLIAASGGTQRWAERYDRELSTETLFELQSEVTRKIVESLQSELAPRLEVPKGKASTKDMEAYRLVTLGRVQLERRTKIGCRRAVEHFRTALGRDPEFSSAWAGLAEALAISVWYRYVDPADHLEQAQRAARRAVGLDPDSAEAHCALATSLGAIRRGPEAMKELKLAVRLQPSFWDAHNRLSYLNQLHGRARPALEAARRAVEINPLSAEAVSNLSLSYLTNGDLDPAIREARRAAELSPGWTTPPFYEAMPLYELGRYDEAVSILEGLTVEWAGLGAEATLAVSHLEAGREASARDVLAAMDPDFDTFAVGFVHLALGDLEEAFDKISQADELTDWACLAIHHLYRNVWSNVEQNRRYQELVSRAYESHGLEPTTNGSPD